MSTQPMPHDPHRFSRATLQPLAKELGLVRARVHEFCGPARRSLAAVLMGQTTGPVLWIFAGWQAERLFPDGLHGFTDPGRVLFAQARRTEDMLWTMEEALRSGAITLIFADLVDIPRHDACAPPASGGRARGSCRRASRSPCPFGDNFDTAYRWGCGD